MKFISVKNPLVAFFCLTYAFSWGMWIPELVLGREVRLLRILGTFGPFLSACFLSVLIGGRKELGHLLKGFLIGRFSLFWYLFCFFSTALIVFTSIGVVTALGSKDLVFNELSKIYLVIPVFLYVLLFSVLGEETGWRGFALPFLQRKYGPLPASIIIGILWGGWHLPLFFTEGNFHQDIPILLFLIQEIALSIVMTWMYNRTRGSLLSVHLFHAASNTTLGVLPVLPMDTGGDIRVLKISIILLVIFSTGLAASGKLRVEENKPKP